ncbi:hypothetical protein, partial [Gallaecimonas pentaromativorans]|uniref:hypothetical protein n=1 Tax=Gallaecimonas pentaromativorans TaxID=584787 RepID=UPI003A8EC654
KRKKKLVEHKKPAFAGFLLMGLITRPFHMPHRLLALFFGSFDLFWCAAHALGDVAAQRLGKLADKMRFVVIGLSGSSGLVGGLCFGVGVTIDGGLLGAAGQGQHQQREKTYCVHGDPSLLKA